MKQMYPIKPNVRGFTLIELLIVIVIIGVLAALLFPVLAASKQAGHRTTCLSSFRQLSMAEALYRQDSDDVIVPRVALSGGQPSQYDKLLEPYVKNNAVWTCTDAGNGDSVRSKSIGLNRAVATAYDGSNPSPKPVYGSTIADSYAVAIFVEDVPSRPNFLPPLEVRNVLVPSVLHACTAITQKAAGSVTNDYAKALMRHNEGGNYSFADGSAKRLNPAQTLMPKIKWFVEANELTDLTGTSQVTSSTCTWLESLRPFAGADQVTGN